MTVWTLSDYLSPAACAPTFIIPIFTRHGSNELFAQNLDFNGSIKEFRIIDPRLFYSVPELAMPITKSIGDNGILAYWKEDGGVIVGESRQLENLLSGYITDDPFADLEIGTFLKDDDRCMSAIDEIVNLLPDREIAQCWRLQEVAAVARPFSFDDDQPNADQTADDREQDFRSLLTEQDTSKWVDKWLKLWGSRYRGSELEELAFWWTDLGPGKEELASPVYLSLARQGRYKRLAEYALSWLSHSTLSTPNWATIWLALDSRFRSISSDLNRIALVQLQSSLTLGAASTPRAWSNMWYQMWRRSNKADCFRLAVEAWKTTGTVGRTFADFVLDPALSDPSCPTELTDAAEYWLKRDMRSVLLWPGVFLNSFARKPSDSLAELGIRWLSYHGGNMNIWRDVWMRLQPYMSNELSFYVAKDWLARARWDLSSWPRVYNDLISNQQFKLKIDDLINLGNSWLAYQRNFPNNRRKIQKAVDYLASISSRN